MCGILAVLSIKARGGAESLRPRVLERVRRIRHRGPDWSGIYADDHNILAHERLAIVGVDSGAQPLLSTPNCCGALSHASIKIVQSDHHGAANGVSTREEIKPIVLCVNGEIYNHRELRQKYCSQSTFVTESDCEVITHLYEYFARDSKKPDKHTSALHSSDAVKELLNSLNGIFAFVLLDADSGNFIIARDHMGIIPLYWGKDEDGSLWVSSEMKAIADVCVAYEDFPPGYFYDSTNDTKHQWYTPSWLDSSIIPSPPSVQLDLNELKNQLIAAVKRQMMSDVPYGVLLSGGLDSSLISAIAASISKEARFSGEHAWWPRLHSFSIGLAGSPDLAAAKKVAQHIGSVHHNYEFTVDEGLNAYDDVIYHLETYDVTTVRAATPMYLMSRKIKAMGVKMVLSGEGADEIFGGYLYFHKCPNESEMQAELVRKLLFLNKYDCLRANKSTMAWGVEARVPFLDREFLDYAMTLVPTRSKMCGTFAEEKGRIEKWCIRQAFQGILPDDILFRQKEQFSDGVGYSWIDSIKARAEQRVSDDEFSKAAQRFPYNTPTTKEGYYIRKVFTKHFPGKSAEETVPGGPSVACSTPAAIAWDESFKKFADQSGRSVVGVHSSAYNQSERDKEKGAHVDEKVVQAGKATLDRAANYKSSIAGKTNNRSSQQHQHQLNGVS